MNALRIGDRAPDFRVKGILRGEVSEYSLSAYRGKWLVLFFYTIASHRSWAEELGGLEYPLLSDEEKSISRAYGVLDEKAGVSLRATFIINQAGSISYQVVSHVNVGRSVEETLRVLKALRTDRLCPSDWKPGDPTGDLGLKY
jgi:peroxiredoxin (alkyl hydroperoxide reductase subunit C)